MVVESFSSRAKSKVQKIALAFLGSYPEGDYEKKTEEDESLSCYEAERPALAFARALTMLARSSSQTGHSDEEASVVFQSSFAFRESRGQRK